MNFPFSFGQTQCSSRLRSPRQSSFTTTSNVSLICLETSHSTSRSSSSNQQHDSISFEMLEGHQEHPFILQIQMHSSYRCQPSWMGSSSPADETILSWSLDGRPIPAPYQYSGNNGHWFCTEESHIIHTPLLCHDHYQQYSSDLLYQQTRRNTFPQPVHRGTGNSPLVPGT